LEEKNRQPEKKINYSIMKETWYMYCNVMKHSWTLYCTVTKFETCCLYTNAVPAW